MAAGPPEQSDMPNHRRALAAAWLLLYGSLGNLSAAASTGPQPGAPFIIDGWDTEDGLPENAIISMTQSREGYLWLGTLNGLVRFDGIRFTVFDESNTRGLNSDRIVHLFEDSQANLWIGTETAGFALMKDGQATSPPEIGLGGPERRLAAACEDATGTVWLYNANGELWRYSKGRFKPFFLGPDVASTNRVIIAEPSGPVWIGTDHRQCAIGPIPPGPSLELPIAQELAVGKLDFLLASQRGGYWRLADGRVQKWATNRLERNLGPYPWRRLTRVSAACEDREGNLLVGTLGEGVFWFDSAGKATCLSTNQGLAYNYILSLLVDREGSLWVGTDGGGLNRVKRQVFDVLEESRGLVVQSVCGDSQGGLWFSVNGVGVNYWKEGVLKQFGARQGLMNLYVRALFADRNQRVWAGTYGDGLFQLQNGFFRQAPGSEAINRQISAMHQDREGKLWVGTEGGLARWDEHDWKVFTTRDGLSAEVVRAIADDADGNLWVGTRGGGLNQLREGRFTSFRKKDGLPSDDISSLCVDAEGVLWIGTFGSGLARLQEGKWTRYTKRDGLISNSIGYLLEDGQGYLWIGSNLGLIRAQKKALNDFARGAATSIPFRAYRKADGLPTSECTPNSQPGAWRTQDGKLWFPTVKALASVNPAQLNPNPHPPPVVIESVLIEGQPQNGTGVQAGMYQTVTVPAGKERVEISYTSLNLAAPERARFKYRLEGHEKAWIEAGDVRIARYSQLPPGHYRFQVTACNEDGVWNETGSTLALTVEPPFWRTWWFLGATAACLLGTIIGAVHYLSTQRLRRQVERLRQQEALEKERARIARDIHDQLGASLTQVSLLGELVEGDKDLPREVEAHARQISQTARDTTRVLDEIVWAVNPANDTLDGLISYVCKHAQEYLEVAGLRFRLEAPPQLPGTPILPDVRHNVFLAAKEAVTNVVRHAHASAVWLRLRLERGTFTLEIEDNGRGMAGLDASMAQTRNGLRNMRRRMEDIRGEFAIVPGPDGGTVVRLTAPFGTDKTDARAQAQSDSRR